ncbi:MAG TPA: general secretion pathway protein GspB [Burkholderiales bacterium]|nr:general secretion pathway protein GspB [Burkholderiales bacterium]
MSFILEALRKSEQERALGREQNLLQFPVATPPAPPTLRPGVVLGLSALLLAGGIAIGWWKPWEKPAPPAREAEAPAPPRVAAAPVPAPAQSAPAPTAAPSRAEALKELRPLLPGGGGSTTPATAKPAPAPSKPEAAAAVPAPAAMAPVLPEVKPAPPAAAKVEDKKPTAKPAPPKDLPPPPNRVLALAELPPALKEALPALAIRGFVYSEDSRSRMVVINDRMLQEGDEVAADLRLERIDPDGIVLNYKGYRFLAPK